MGKKENVDEFLHTVRIDFISDVPLSPGLDICHDFGAADSNSEFLYAGYDHVFL